MTESTSQQALQEGARALEQASARARRWVNRVADGAGSVRNEQRGLVDETLRSENLARKLAGSAERRSSVGVFGPSQAGKSYLVSVLAKNQESTQPLMANFAGTLKNFIAEINPPGDRESTGLVTRFTTSPGTIDTTHPVELRLFTETDLVKILGNSFLSDFDPNNRKVKLPSEEAVRALVTSLESQAGAAQAHLDEIAMFDLGEYFRSYFSNGVEPLDKAGYWDALVRIGHRLPAAGRARLYAVLWGDLPDFTAMYTSLNAALGQLQHAPQARAAIEALTPRDDSIIDVQVMVQRLGTPEDVKDTISVTPEWKDGRTAPPARIPRAVLTALVAEVKVVIAERPWAFFDHTDLLDFPGARSRSQEIDLESVPQLREAQVRQMLLRGKIAYLFQRYTDERELTSMLLCMPPSVQEVKNLSAMVTGWVKQTHGKSPELRRALSCALFWVLTKFDTDFIEKEGDTAASRQSKLARRLGSSFLDLYGREEWALNWDGAPFNNTVFLRNPGMKQTHLISYGDVRRMPDGSEQRLEIGIIEEALPKIAEIKAGFMAAAECEKHFRDRTAAWDAAFTLNDGGVAYLVRQLDTVLSPTLKSEQLGGRLVERAKSLDGALRRYYEAEDDAARDAKETALTLLRRQLGAATQPRRFRNFVQLLGCMKLDEAEVRAAFLNVGAMRLDDEPQEAPPDLFARGGGFDFDMDFGTETDGPATAAAPVPAQRRTRDRYDLFATQVMNLWTERARALSTQARTLAAIGLEPQLVTDLVSELVIGANRNQLAETIAERVRSQVAAANLRWDDVADRSAGIATMLVNDYVAYLGYAQLPPAARPAQPEPPHPRQRGIFTAPPMPGRGVVPTLGKQRVPLEQLYFIDWGIGFKQASLDNIGFAGGREIGEEDNRELGRILGAMAPALQVVKD